MSVSVGVLDYGMGNLHSVEKAFHQAGAKAFVSHDPKRLTEAELLVVPGVGSFAAAMTVLRQRKLDRFIREWISADRPYLGICLGLQLLFEASEESPGKKGLGVLKGKVVKFKLADRRLKVPHMGWNEVHPVGVVGVWKKVLPRPAHFYFVHSFLARPSDLSLVWSSVFRT